MRLSRNSYGPLVLGAACVAAGLCAWRAFVKEAAESLGYTQTRWHTFKRMDTVAATHERMPCFDDSLHGLGMLGLGRQ